MSDLEHLGLIYAPHVSAGRLPTQAGLRFFVDAFMELGDLSDEERRGIEAQVKASGSGATLEHMLTEASQMLSGMSRGAGLVRARCAAIRANLFSTDVISFPSYRRWRFHCRQLDGDTDCSSWSDPFAYLASVLWPEASDKRRWFPLPPRLHFIYILPRLLRYLKWNYITSSPARNKPNSEART